MPRFSANLGFLWQELPLPDAIRAAARAGFDAVECHWPYEVPVADVLAVLSDTGLPMLGVNTSRGREGEFGLSALPGQGTRARASVDEAIAYAEATDARAIHVMAGVAQGPAAHEAFLETLAYACAQTDRTVLIEPLNRYDAPGYFLRDTGQAQDILTTVGAPNAALMFDCYHVARTEGDLLTRLTDLWPIIGHIQFAAVPDRGPPDHGEIAYSEVFEAIDRMGWPHPIGAEYIPQGATEASLDWMQTIGGRA